jgi:Flp pilus assembly CpaE family ATPase
MLDFHAEPDVSGAPVPASAAAPLLAVCGLSGGAGASTLAYLVGRATADQAEDPVLVCDSGGPTGGLAAYASAESPRSLCGLANAISAHEAVSDGLFADAAAGLRMIATRPQLGSDIDRDGLQRLLRDAREAHGLTVVDCGTPRTEADVEVLRAATHVAWVLPATLSGIRRGSRVLALFGVDASRREIVVARHDAAGRRAPMKQLTELAGERNAPLVLMPHVPDLAERPAEEALDAAQLTLDGLRSAIGR